MNEYQVTFNNGEVAEIGAWTPEIAKAIAEEDANVLSVVGVELLTFQQSEP